VITEQEKYRFCRLSSCVSDTLKITLAGLNYLFSNVISSHEKDEEGKITSFYPEIFLEELNEGKISDGSIRTELRLSEYEASRIDSAQMIMPCTHGSTFVVDFHNCAYIIVRYF